MKINLIVLALFGLSLFSCKERPKINEAKPAENTELEQLSLLIKGDSNNAALYNQRANYYLSRNDVALALNDINKALQKNSKDQALFLTLAEIYLKMGQPDGCNSALQKAVEIDPENSVPYFRLAELNLLLEDYTTAMMYADRSLNMHQLNPDAHFVKGLIYLAKNDTTNAIRNFQFSLDQRELFLEPLIQLGKIYTIQRNNLAALYLEKAIRQFPEAYDARYQLALYLQDNERVEEALIHYDTLLQLLPENKYVLFNIGYLQLVYLNNFEKAIQFFDEVLLNDPNYVDALYNKGRALEELGQFMNSREIYNEVLRRESNHHLAIEALNRLDLRR
ncbi:MAG: tetratricopeptide repeat protein [Bacteroidetes bacterium]|nr:MAG: tetratricopeptide repeat protein [Bacteroidota bacterium]